MSSTRGDKPTIRGSESDKKAFTAFVIGVFKEKGTRLLRMSMKDVSEAMQALPRVHPVKNYTNMYGNLKGALVSEDFSGIFSFDGSVIVLASPEDLTASAKAGRLDQELAEACLAMHKAKAEADAEARRLNPHLFPQE